MVTSRFVLNNPIQLVTLLVAVLGCVGFLLGHNRAELRRHAHLNQLPSWSSTAPREDPASPTGYELGQRMAVIPGHNQRSFDTIALTQQWLAGSELGTKRIGYANTPAGHRTYRSSLYPRLLGTVAIVDHQLHGRPLGRSVESAAAILNPGLLVFFLVGAAAFIAWVFGWLPAVLFALGMATLLPLREVFTPGLADPVGLHVILVLAALLLVLAGLHASREYVASGRKIGSARVYLVASGVAGGLALWLDAASTLPVLTGLVMVAILHAAFSKTSSVGTLPWHLWGIAGASATLTGYTLDYFPHWEREVFRHAHPLYALAWIGAGQTIVRMNTLRGADQKISRASLLFLVLGVLAVAQLPFALWLQEGSLYAPDGPDTFRLSPVSPVAAPTLAAWLTQDAPLLHGVAVLCPLSLLALTAYCFLRTDAFQRAALTLVLGAMAAALLVGIWRLSYWSHVQVVWLVLMIASVQACAVGIARWISAGIVMLGLLPAALHEFKSRTVDEALSTAELESYLERDLAHWLRQHAQQSPTVLAPPQVSTALAFYGGMSGLGSFDRDNEAGTAAAVRLVSAASVEEAWALVESRKLTHIVLPFWDNYLEEYRRMGLGREAPSDRIEMSFLARLQQWQLPAWLRLVPYRLPAGQGIEGSIIILQVVDEQAPAVAAARLVDYFLEMDQLDQARRAVADLNQYPNDLGALAAICSVAAASRQEAEMAQSFRRLLAAVARPERRRPVWERRVGVAIVLAQQKRADLAKQQLAKCLAEIDAEKLHSLTTISLYRFNLLCKLYGMDIDDPDLRNLSRSLLRPDLRERL